jgi:ABC-type phosphate transport system substrate-binding protein
MWRSLSALLCGLALLLTARVATADEHLVVIVPPQRAVQLTVEEVAQIYLRKRRFWAPGEPVVPINRDAGSAARALFTRAVFGGQARWLATYWNRQYFQGVLPPATLASDEAVKRFVACEPHAIGYIDAAMVDDSVRVVLHLYIR